MSEERTQRRQQMQRRDGAQLVATVPNGCTVKSIADNTLTILLPDGTEQRIDLQPRA